MAARIVYVDPADQEVLKRYLACGDNGIALVFPEAQAEATRNGLEDGDDIDYDFGGEADLLVETIFTTSHYLIQNHSKQG